jgi:hypothetical protein
VPPEPFGFLVGLVRILDGLRRQFFPFHERHLEGSLARRWRYR